MSVEATGRWQRRILLIALTASLGVNFLFWKTATMQRERLLEDTARLAEMDSLRAQAAEAEKLRPAAVEAERLRKDTDELARLRNEIGPLRKQAGEIESLRAQAAEAGQLRAQLAGVKRELTTAENNMADVAKLTPEEHLALKNEAQATLCINNMKQIGLAARLYAKANGNIFPPDLPSLKNELATPKILFCPAAPGGVQAADWAQLNPSSISYQFLNPNGNEADTQKPLTMCPIHGHVGYSDGSVHKTKSP